MALSENEQMYLYELESDIEDGNVYKMVEWASFYYYNHPEMIDDELSEQIVEYYEEGVDVGISLAALNLGAMYYSGIFIEQDFKKAIELYMIAAESDCLADICRRLGEFYLFGRETEKDLVKAIKMLSQAEALTYEKIYNKDPFAPKLLPKITELLEKAKSEFSV